MITLTPQQEETLLEQVKTTMVERLLGDRRDDLQLLTPQQVSGLLNLDPRSWQGSIPRVVVTPSTYRYRAADVAAYIAKRTESTKH
jgi:hypothetical protein